MPNLKHHFNVYVIAKGGPLTKESIQACEIAMAGILNTTMKMHGDPDLIHEVIYCEIFDADLEEMGGASSEQLKVHACGDPDCAVPHPAPHKEFPGYPEKAKS